MKIKEHVQLLQFIFRGLLISSFIGLTVGSASAFFLISLEWATNWREAHPWIIWTLPFGGMAIGLIYHYFGKEVEGGNNLIIQEIQQPTKLISILMAPLVLIGTVATHFFGGSAGREGTAVQMGGSIADQLHRIFQFDDENRRMLIAAGVSAGFASVFGTPLAGAIFGLEMAFIGRINYKSILPCFLSAALADYVTTAWGVGHTAYFIDSIPPLSTINILWIVFGGLIFGLAGRIFSVLTRELGKLYGKHISYAPFRPFVGGVIIALLVWVMGTTKYIGLGIPTIVEAFFTPLPAYDFALKIIFTAITLGAGYKGGEVTPLFFIGATLGNALAFFIPLPMALLAGCGFVAVFAAAANTPLACIFMGIELFGAEGGTYIGIACIVAYLFSGHTGIYKAQIVGSAKNAHPIHEEKTLHELNSK